MDFVALAIGTWIGGLAVYAILRLGARAGEASAPADTTTPVAEAPAAALESPTPEPPAAPAEMDARTRVFELARQLEEPYQQAERGSDFENEPRFLALVELLAGEAFDTEQRLSWTTSQNMPLSCAAFAAMAKAGDQRYEDVARLMHRIGYFPAHFALQYLGGAANAQACAITLLRASPWWADYAATRDALAAYLDRMQALGIEPSLPEAMIASDWHLEERRDFLGQLSHPMIARFLDTLARLERVRRGQREMARVGRALSATAPEDATLAITPLVRERIDALLDVLQRPGQPSFVLVGPEGVGKTTIAQAALRELAAQGWRVVEATPSQLLAGQKYIGELEQRIEDFIAGFGGGKAVWFVPEAHQLLEQGMSSGNQNGLLDRLIPYLERGELQVLGESTVEAWTRVLAARPRAETLLTGLKIEPMNDAEAVLLVREWAAQKSRQLARDIITEADAGECCELARQQYPARAEPGRSLELLKDALAAATAQDPPGLPIGRAQLLAALSRRSGLPLEILDASQPLEVAQVREYFSSRVIGQDEAVDCLVDRISMLKAGLTDPRRPIGVFLFAGPAGTGKTEIAKTLAGFLFGGSERMLRVDMSEFQSEDSQFRLLGEGGGGSASLASRVRQQPFSVVLLDEFEKAHPRIWDLFLQVFDDGRLTDRVGNVADFRHCIIILTSNLGSTIDKGGGPGFVSARGSFSREQVDRTIDATFRREFVNRLDRVVVFKPLTRALMRDILHKELRGVLARRGFRTRDWAVEWEPSAIEFLLEKGFTPDLGARPLRRAIDQYLLAPLSRTIVEHRVPSGEQFLFVQGDADGLQVRFVDPDAPSAAAGAAAVAPAPADTAGLRSLALDPRAGRDTMEVLLREIEARAARVADPAWQALKDRHAAEMQRREFWQRNDRHLVLDRIERIDRIEAGLRSATALHARLARSGARGASDLVRRLALLVSSLEHAICAVIEDEPEDALIEVRPADARSAQALAWRDRIVEMYARWGEARGMRVHRPGADPVSGAVVVEVSGLGAWRALRQETGMHVLETRMGDSDLRHSVRVAVRPVAAHASLATESLDETRICRRYDDGPSPLVRDNVRGWRSGRLERVLAGDFDLIDSA